MMMMQDNGIVDRLALSIARLDADDEEEKSEDEYFEVNNKDPYYH